MSDNDRAYTIQDFKQLAPMLSEVAPRSLRVRRQAGQVQHTRKHRRASFPTTTFLSPYLL